MSADRPVRVGLTATGITSNVSGDIVGSSQTQGAGGEPGVFLLVPLFAETGDEALFLVDRYVCARLYQGVATQFRRRFFHGDRRVGQHHRQKIEHGIADSSVWKVSVAHAELLSD
jgi:hypothetical protein